MYGIKASNYFKHNIKGEVVNPDICLPYELMFTSVTLSSTITIFMAEKNVKLQKIPHAICILL